MSLYMSVCLSLKIIIFSSRTTGPVSNLAQSTKNHTNEGPHTFTRELGNSKNKPTIFVNLLQNHWANFNKTWHKASLGKGNQVCSNDGRFPFPWGDNSEIVKVIDNF